MRCRCQHNQVTLCIGYQALQQFKTQLFAYPAGCAGVRLINDHAFWCDRKEILAMTFALDVVKTDDHDGMMIEQAHTVGQVAFNAAGTG